MPTPDEHVVGAAGAGARLDVFLAEVAGSRAAAQKLIDAGLVTVDGEARPKRWVLSEGERVAVSAPEPEARAPAAPASFTVRFEDEHLLVVDKPAGVVVHPARGHRAGTLVQALEGRVAGGEHPWRAGVVHRLDKDTSGLLILTRSDAVHAAMKAQIAARAVVREYLALVEGRPPARSGRIDAPLGRDRRVRMRISTDTEDPREAVTHFDVEEVFPAATLLRVRLETGRTHQIRAHLLAIGHPVCGDPEYGTAGLLGLERQFLHAARLEFDHPVLHERVEVTSELPADLAAVLARLRSA